MKVLHVVNKMDPSTGGVCEAVRLLIAGLENHKVASEVISLDDPDALYLKKYTFKTHALGTGKTAWGYNKKLVPWLVKNLSNFNIVVLHGLWLYNGYATRKAITILKKKFLASDGAMPSFFVMPHGMLDPYFQKENNRKLKAIRNYIYWKLIESKTINAAKALLFTCERERQLAQHTFHPYRPQKEIILGLGIQEPPAFSDAIKQAFYLKCPELKNEPFILFLGRIHEKKGVDILIHAYENLHKESVKNRSTVPKLVIAGPGLDTKMGLELQAYVQTNPMLKNFVWFPGMLEGDAKWGAFYNCEAFILPSHQENFGISVVEALACNKPVLISNQINIWKEIIAGGGGIVADDSLEGTKKLLKDWSNLSFEERMDMAKNAGRVFHSDFKIETISQRLIDSTN